MANTKRILCKLLDDGLPGLANQLWTVSALVAFAAETGAKVQTPCFFRVAHYFEDPPVVGWPSILRWLPLGRRLRRYVYLAVARLQLRLCPASVIDSGGRFCLPPAEPVDSANRLCLERISGIPGRNWLLRGWLFRNPTGLLTHRQRILAAFRPKTHFRKPAEMAVTRLRQRARFVVGLHWRQGDYRDWESGRYLVCSAALRIHMEALCRSLAEHEGHEHVGFLVCSDGPIPRGVLDGFQSESGPGTEIGDLYALSLCDRVMGSHSTYGRWAAYYGGVRFRCMTNDLRASIVEQTVESLAG